LELDDSQLANEHFKSQDGGGRSAVLKLVFGHNSAADFGEI